MSRPKSSWDRGGDHDPGSLAVYALTDRRSGAVYIGAAQNVKRRWYFHRSELRNGRHPHQVALADGWKAGTLDLTILEQVDSLPELTAAEQRWIQDYRARGELILNVKNAPYRSYSSWAVPSLRAVRLQHLLTQGELAQRAGVNIATVVRLENGASAQASTIRKLAAVLRVKPAQLMAPEPTN